MKTLIKPSVLSIPILVILSGFVISPALGEIRDSFLIGDILENSETRFIFYFLGIFLIMAVLISLILLSYPKKLFETRYDN